MAAPLLSFLTLCEVVPRTTISIKNMKKTRNAQRPATKPVTDLCLRAVAEFCVSSSLFSTLSSSLDSSSSSSSGFSDLEDFLLNMSGLRSARTHMPMAGINSIQAGLSISLSESLIHNAASLTYLVDGI